MELDSAGPLAGRPYFFEDGLQFECLQCGDCCGGAPGTIYVSDREILCIAAHLQLDVDEFCARYLYRYRDSYSIGEDRQGRCLFFDDGCTIYAIRPHQCRAFPFWYSNLRSEDRWRRITTQCPGIGRGRTYTKNELLRIAGRTTHI